ncbi:K+-transporting ATPase ATPase C chain [Methylobacterium sp. ap11]|uniref:K(+)-transporting ATPase subunit C n=1 Tax=Methylobacterium sp. ap11 TaxID=1761799 RepID=UPI0008D19EB1|nr:K(+)-transporting ATPase subunit C [Methylobacterium sp. ap11]SEP48219.1 K+-transporting ATPase ATPase C chain [Methylobacterium sp. ap11]
MLKHLRPTLVLTVALLAITGIAYPLAMTGIAGAIFPAKAAGSLVERDGVVIGSALIGQNFTADGYFHGRLSATVAPDPADASKTVAAPYNAANSGGSNLGPTSQALLDRVKDDVAKLKSENPSAPVPLDLVTTSGSGLDPDISPEAALFQAPRIAKARGVAEDRIKELVAAQTEGRLLGVLGEPRVSVLALNLALDAQTGKVQTGKSQSGK